MPRWLWSRCQSVTLCLLSWPGAQQEAVSGEAKPLLAGEGAERAAAAGSLWAEPAAVPARGHRRQHVTVQTHRTKRKEKTVNSRMQRTFPKEPDLIERGKWPNSLRRPDVQSSL